MPFGGSHSRQRRPLLAPDPATGCVIYSGAIAPNGYPSTVSYKGRYVGAHVRAFLEAGNEIPEGFQLDHLCRTRACINPEHLEAVTNTENQRRRPDLKLSLEKAEQIRQRARRGETQRTLARAFGVAQPHIHRVIHGERWV